MQPVEIDSTRSLAGAFGETIWGWEIPVYLFLGGVTAGLMIVIAALILTRGAARITEGMRLGLLLAPVSLSLGMLALLIDLSNRVNVFRFYTTLQPTAPMSFGSWVLILVYPVLGLMILALPWRGLEPWLVRGPRALRTFAERHLSRVAWAALVGGVALGLYTGVLLAVTVARPLWSSGALGLLFLVSGVVAGISVLSLLERDREARLLFTRLPVAVLAIELVLVFSWLAGLLTQGPLAREAAHALLTGRFAPAFVGFVLFGGMVLPASLEALALSGRAAHSRLVPVLALFGGLILRWVIVAAGQTVGYAAA